MFRGDKDCWNIAVCIAIQSEAFFLPCESPFLTDDSVERRPSLMEATVCYDDGTPPVAKFTEKEIHIIVRQSQCPRGCVCVAGQSG